MREALPVSPLHPRSIVHMMYLYFDNVRDIYGV